MQHLTIEELARLVDETPTSDERTHLAACVACQDELEALRLQTAALSELPLRSPPARQWPVLEAKLRHHGLIQPAARSVGYGAPRLLRAAAYIGLFLAGSVAGLAVGRTGGGSDMQQPVAAGTDLGAMTVAQTPGDAAQRLQEAETAYLVALQRYSELTGTQRGANPAARLAALEGIVLTTRAALESAPADPVINGYYLTAVGQRDAVLRQIVQTADDPWF